MSVASWRSAALRTVTNLRGWRTSQPTLVFESDDWGATRLPGRDAQRAMASSGLKLGHEAYDRVDCLEDREDLASLFEVLATYRGGDDKPAAFTFNTVLGNPDFEAIAADNFERFHHRDLFASYLHAHGEDLRGLWEDAAAAGLMRPQFHAREHLNVDLWLADLRRGERQTRIAFDHGYYALTRSDAGRSRQRHYLAAYWSESASHLRSILAILRDGLTMFERLFGFRTRTMIACNYVWPSALETAALEEGVVSLQGQRGHIVPRADGGAPDILRHHTGQRNHLGQLYTVRNVYFEPFEDGARDWTDTALAEIAQAFRLRRPAIVSTHRANYVGGLDRRNRERSLSLLDALLAAVTKRWPDVVFKTSDALADLMLADG